MLKRLAIMFAATAAIAVPATGAFASTPPKTNGVLPPAACFAVYPAPLQPALCGQGHGAKP
jgi:hypothetical protein